MHTQTHIEGGEGKVMCFATYLSPGMERTEHHVQYNSFKGSED